jgi:hypothetical protein
VPLLLDPAPRRSSRRLLGLVVAAVLAVAAGFAGWSYLSRPFSPLDSPEGRALGRSVAVFLVEEQANLRAGGSPEAQKERATAVLDPEARRALGPDVSARLEALLRTTVDVEAAQDPSPELRNRFAQEGILLDQALTARGLPYFIDASLIRFSRATMPILYSYYIERENTLSGPEKHVRSLFVRRLDDLNFRNAAVGYTKPSSTAALVLLDDVESQLIELLLPAGAAGDDTLLVDLDSVDPESDWQRDLRARSAAIVKAAYGDLPGASPAQVEELGALFHRRRWLVRSWIKALGKQHARLRVPRRLLPEADYANELVGKVPLAELREWRAIHERLMERPVLAAFDAIVLRRALSVEQHEAQHRLDYDRDRILVPPRVQELLGLRSADDAYDSDFAMYVANEVSAYLAELARAPESPALALMSLSQSAFDREEWGGAYCYAALVVIDGLAAELGAGGEKLVARGKIDRAALTRRFLAVTDRPEVDLRAAARRVWEAWYEAALPEVKQEKTVTHHPWRH